MKKGIGILLTAVFVIAGAFSALSSTSPSQYDPGKTVGAKAPDYKTLKDPGKTVGAKAPDYKTLKDPGKTVGAKAPDYKTLKDPGKTVG
ncbi:hypothetical protein [Bacillus sp. 1P06AnD]|uniref:hypothetical protein n=1 Tax=Bacillus sp. 1P06AnD TaxID=3132208 RepID=UPI0039A0282A